MQPLFEYLKVDSTVRYLGSELQDALGISERINIQKVWASGPAIRQSRKDQRPCCRESANGPNWVENSAALLSNTSLAELSAGKWLFEYIAL